jgi:hypothetical protein
MHSSSVLLFILLYFKLLINTSCLLRIHMAPFSDEYLYVEMANKVLNHC